jgi:hypothetical protein
MGLKNNLWISWTDFLKRDFGNEYDIINTSKVSYGQSLIVKSLIDELIERDFQVDYVIVQWSAVSRAYSTHQRDFYDKILKEGNEKFAPYTEEYIIDSSSEGWVTDKVKTVDLEYYTNSIDKIILFKYLLESKNIPYTMFWGWEQITSEIYKKRKKWIDIMYSGNFWRFGEHGGMSEYIIDGIGKEKGIIPNDFHPTTKGQEYFYNTIIRNIIDEKESYNNSQRIL